MKYSHCRWLVPLFCLALIQEAPAAEYQPTNHDGVTKVGDLFTYGIPTAAMGVAACFKDGEGAWQLTKSGLLTMGVSVAIKYSVKSRRPNNDPYSMPSGHAAISYVSAEFLRKRYGWKYGLPAYLGATFVGYARVRANEHYVKDIAVAGAVGIASAYLFTTPYHGWHVQPEFTAQQQSLRVSRDF